MNRDKIKVTVGLLTGHTTLQPMCFNSHTLAGMSTVRGRRRRYCTCGMSLSGTGKQKKQNTGSYVLEDQGSRKHEGECYNKPGSQYQAGRNNLTPLQKS